MAELNDKASLADLLPPEAVPERRVVEQPELAAVLSSGVRSLPLVLKASSRLGSGAGADVLICRTQDDLEGAGPKFAPASRVVVERFYQFSATWCVHFALSDERVRFCGTAQQICDPAGAYLGNWSAQASPSSAMRSRLATTPRAQAGPAGTGGSWGWTSDA